MRGEPRGEPEGGHVIPLAVYYRVFAALMALLVLTIAAAVPDFGPLGLLIAVTIATVKAVLIGLYFMHLRFHRGLVPFVAAAGLLWLAIMFALTITDYAARASG